MLYPLFQSVMPCQPQTVKSFQVNFVQKYQKWQICVEMKTSNKYTETQIFHAECRLQGKAVSHHCFWFVNFMLARGVLLVQFLVQQSVFSRTRAFSF